MGSSHERLFGVLPNITAPAYLCERVLDAVARKRMRQVRIQLVLSSLSGMASFTGVIFAGRALMTALSQSGFTSYTSLLFSDGGAVMSYGQTFALSLLESLPGPEVAITLALVAILIQSLRVLATSAMQWISIRPASFSYKAY
ncbi:MAG: hypothetical protein WAV21_00825 [Minisyncoccia bacterium]